MKMAGWSAFSATSQNTKSERIRQSPASYHCPKAAFWASKGSAAQVRAAVAWFPLREWAAARGQAQRRGFHGYGEFNVAVRVCSHRRKIVCRFVRRPRARAPSVTPEARREQHRVVLGFPRLYWFSATICCAGLFSSTCALTFCKPAVSASICFCCSASLD